MSEVKRFIGEARDHDIEALAESGLHWCRRCKGGEIELDTPCVDRLATKLSASEAEVRRLKSESEDGDIYLILWHVAERLMREGWEFSISLPPTRWMALNEDSGCDLGFFPTLAAAVEAAWQRETGARP